MQIIGFNIEKIEAEKNSQNNIKDLKVKYNANIKSITLEEINIGKKQEILKVNFEFKVEYDPDIGKIFFAGHILIMEDPKKARSIAENWNKEKDTYSDFSLQMVNIILLRANIKALIIANEVNLPPHIPLPRVMQQSKKVDPNNYIG